MHRFTLITILFLLSKFTFCQSEIMINLITDNDVEYKVFNNNIFENEQLLEGKSINKTIKFIFNSDIKPGLYTIKLNTNKTIDFIYNKSNVEFNYNVKTKEKRFFEETENKIYAKSIHTLKDCEKKLINLSLSYYPQSDKMVKRKLKRDYNFYNFKYENCFEKAKKYELVYKILNLKHSTYPNLRQIEKKYYISFINSYFDNIDFKDSTLTYPHFFKRRIEMYFKYVRLMYSDESNYYKRVGKITRNLFFKVKDNLKLHDFLVNFLLEIFDKRTNPEIHYNLLEYKGRKCDISLKKEIIKSRVGRYKKIKVGTQAPEILWQESHLNKGYDSLYEIEADYTLVLFWHIHCKYCAKLLPKLLKYYIQNKAVNIEILAFSVDDNLTEWKKFIKKKGYKWINVIGYDGWLSEAPENYSIYNTPSMYLLDVDKKIIAKPNNFEQIIINLKEL